MRGIKFRFIWQHEETGRITTVCYTIDELMQCKFNYSYPRHNLVAILQFTGLHDKNGVEIFESDIVVYEPEWIKLHENPQVVKYEKHGYSPFEYYGGGEYDAAECRVIGNIYEHGHLLK